MEILELLYKEHSRINAAIDAMVNSSFSDFQLLATVGIMLAWEPMSEKLTQNTNRESAEILLIGFSTMLIVIALIATRDLMKQSIVMFNISELDLYASQINSLLAQKLNSSSLEVFKTSEHWRNWAENTHFTISIVFRLLVLILVYFLPVLLLRKHGIKYSLIYTGIFIFIVSISSISFFVLLRSVTG